MLTGAGNSRDFAGQASIARKKLGLLALGADEAGLLGRLLAVEPDLGDGAPVPT